MRKILYLSIILSVGLIASCKKDHNNNTATSYINLDKDSIYYYEKEDYLWFDAIPAYNTFNPRSYTGSTDFDALSNEITAISQLKINPATGKPYEYYALDPGEAKYSFVDDGTTTASLGGSNADFGFEPKYLAANDLRVKYVYPGSPADIAGLKRGYEITSINGNTDLSGTSNSNINYIVNAIYYSPSINMTLLKPDNTTITVNFNTAAYTVNPVLTYKVFNEGSGHVVGYVVFNSFTTIDNAQPKLDQAFNYFINNGVNDLIVDLRYNGGGAAETAEYLDDLIVPQGAGNTLMYTQHFNSNLLNGNSPLFDKKFGTTKADFQPTNANNRRIFSKQLSLAINRVFFIVTSETASSSELTMNNLRPEMDVELVGDTTYGKPVGEYAIPLGSDGRYILYSPQVYVENSANQGDYYAGMTPGSGSYKGYIAVTDIFKDGDDLTKDFGDSTENMLAHALSYVKTGTYAINKPQVQSLLAGKQLFTISQQKAIMRKMDQHKYKALIFNKKHK